MRAIVVDDSKAMRTIIGRIVKQLGFEVAEASHGQEAIERLNESQADLALVDWNMPGMNGFELVKSIRTDPRHDAMRIMMVTTEAVMDNVASALAAGANEYVMKPFTPEVLKEKLAILGFGD
jgi:two-component system chemotaxis response regulator CheY